MKHGFDFPANSPNDGASFSQAPHTVQRVGSSSTGFTQVHVSGLPADCEDDAVEAKLRQVLQDAHGRTATLEAKRGVSADGEVTPREADSATTEAEAERQKSASHCEDDVFVSCAVVRNKDTLACKGYCFLAFNTSAQAEAAVQTLNGGVEVAGAQVQAQLSIPKAAKLKPDPAKTKQVELNDLRLRRKRYTGVSKHASYGHEGCSSGRVEGGGNTKTRNSAGRLQGVAGTRDGRPVHDDASKCSSRSGFTA